VTLPGDAGPISVLDGVSFVVSSGELVDIVGPSGSGKSTFLRSLARLLPEIEGTLLLDGLPAEAVEAHEWRCKVALLPQKAAIVRGTVRENLVLPWRLKIRSEKEAPDDTVLRAALDRVNLGEVDLGRNADRLSVGQAARIALTRVMLTEPEVLLLDEPDANLDDASAEQVRRMTQTFVNDGGAVVRVRHQRGDDLATRRLRLEHGHLGADDRSAKARSSGPSEEPS
jgi:putative ABC transport system ATP-binding protein